jgi:hypothetical protein
MILLNYVFLSGFVFLSGADLDHFFFFFRSGWDFCAVSANLQKVGKIAIFI